MTYDFLTLLNDKEILIYLPSGVKVIMPKQYIAVKEVSLPVMGCCHKIGRPKVNSLYQGKE